MSNYFNNKPFKPTKVGIIKAVGQKIGSLIKGKGKVSPTITKVKPNVGSPSKSALNKQIQKTKAAGAKLAQTLFESKNKAFKGNDFTFATNTKKTPSKTELKKKKDDDAIAKEFGVRFKKAKGGRVGLKRGTGLRGTSNVEKIKKAFGPKQKPQSRMTRKKKFPDLTGDGKVTFADILKGRGVINGKKKKKVI